MGLPFLEVKSPQPTSGVEQPVTACCDRTDHTDSTKLGSLTEGGFANAPKHAESYGLWACANGVAKQTKRAR